MAKDKFSAVWVSHTSIRMFRDCPRAYYLGNIYRDPVTNHKLKIMSPPLALGQAVHEVVESLSLLPAAERMNESLVLKFDKVWEKVSGKKGGFVDIDTEHAYKVRGQEMLRRLMNRPGLLSNPAIKIKQDLPYYWLSEENNIILCGKLDWLEYLPDTNGVHIIDFKTGKRSEDPNSLQLPIYHLLAHHCQSRTVEKASYWYIARTDTPEEQQLPNLDEAHETILDIAKTIKMHRQLKKFACPQGDDQCRACRPYERVIAGEGELVGVDEYKSDVYILPPKEEAEKEGEESYIH